MQIEALALVLRPRSMWQGADLGVRLLQSRLATTYTGYLAVALPVFLACGAAAPLAAWLPALLIWIAKPWLDRTILFILSRALFGESTSLHDLWRARRDVWWSHLASTLTLRRLSASRSFTQPVLQLEGLRGRACAVRLRQLTTRHRAAARAMTQAFAVGEIALLLSILSLQAWLAPHSGSGAWTDIFWHPDWTQVAVTTTAYAAAVAFLEPFYVAAGFGMYVNRRVELEAWDIEQEFRSAFAR